MRVVNIDILGRMVVKMLYTLILVALSMLSSYRKCSQSLGAWLLLLQAAASQAREGIGIAVINLHIYRIAEIILRKDFYSL